MRTFKELVEQVDALNKAEDKAREARKNAQSTLVAMVKLEMGGSFPAGGVVIGNKTIKFREDYLQLDISENLAAIDENTSLETDGKVVPAS